MSSPSVDWPIEKSAGDTSADYLPLETALLNGLLRDATP